MYMFICYNTCMFTALSKVQVPNKMTETAGLFFFTQEQNMITLVRSPHHHLKTIKKKYSKS